jgi:hypothetical protein
MLAPMAEIFEAPPTYRLELPAGTTSIWLDRNWLLSHVEGRFETAHCDLFLSSADEIVRRAKRVRCAHDCQPMTSFEISTAARIVKWAVTNRAALMSSNLVVQSPLIAMAARSANVSVGNVLTVTSDRATWLRAIAAHG